MKWGDLQNRVDDFGRKADREFSFSELIKYFQDGKIDVDEGALYEIALASEILIEVDSLDKIFALRQHFFMGAQFRFTPLASEVKHGYVVPGHRFMPFLSRTVFPADVTLVLPDGSVVPTRQISLSVKQALPFLHFFGSDGSAEYLILDKEENAKCLNSSLESRVELTGFDFSAYFESCNFHSGNALMLTVTDWQMGRFEVQAVPAQKRLDLAKNRDWINAMTQALEDAITELGVQGDCYEQFALALRNAPENSPFISLMTDPPMSFAEWFNQQKNWAVKEVADRALFWEIDKDPLDDLWRDSMENPPEPESELDAWFQKLGLSLSEEESVAYMLDALFHGEERANAVLARILEGRSLQFSSEEDQARFHFLWQTQWDEVRKNYSRDADSSGDLRSRLLACNDRCLAILRTLDVKGVGFEIIQNPAFMELNKFSAVISDGLGSLNDLDSDAPPFPEEVLDQMMLILDEMEDQLVGGAVEEKEPLAQHLYQLKVSLKGAKPPIWRRLIVPSSMELEGLHYTIQAAMGWEDYHLHQFLVGRTSFQPGYAEDSFPGSEFENYDGVLVSDLLRQEKDKIIYEYDFGDSWEHVVQLEKILPLEDGKILPVCIKGKRACPPEDCGGVWGYNAILNNDDSFQDKSAIRSYRKMIGDPEAFDLDVANQRIQEWFS